jgi:Fe-S-cluster containining protein
MGLIFFEGKVSSSMADAGNESRTTAKASFALPVGGGFLHASAQLPTGQTTLTELLPIVRNLENAITGRVAQEAEAAGSPISCKAGCAACCRQMVPVSLFEAEALMNWIRSLPEVQQRMIEQRFHRALNALRDAGVIDKVLDPEWTRNEGVATEIAVTYFKAGVACPFLENENCGIYSMRPLACREYMVTSPREWCSDPAVFDVFGIQLPLKLSHVLYAFGRKMERDTRGWIPLVFLLAWGKSGVVPGEYVSGTGEEVLRRFLEQTAETAEQEKAYEAPSEAADSA